MHSPTDKASHDCVGRLIERLDEAVSSESVRARCRAIKDVLSDATRGRLHLDAQFLETADDGYARRLLHRDPDGRYSIVVMVWDRGQRTPIHDHDGTWCVECVYDGTIKVTSFDMVESHESGKARFVEAEEIYAGIGEAGALIPPFEYHVISNPAQHPAVTIHVYGGELKGCHAFEPDGEGAWDRRWHDSWYDN